MSNEELANYIRQQQQAGVGQNDIKNNLVAAGWQENDIDDALKNFKPRKRRRWLKILLIILAIIITPILLLLLTIGILSNINTDGPAVDDSDLQLQVVSIPDSENAYFDLKNALAVYPYPAETPAINKIDELKNINDYLGGQTWDDAVVANNIEKNNQALLVFDQAATKPKFQVPELADPSKVTPNTLLPAFNWLRIAARQKVLKALYLSKNGQDEDAFNELSKVLAVGQSVQNSQGPLIQYLVGVAIKDLAIRAVQDISKITILKSSDLIVYANKLSQFSENSEGLKAAFKGEYLAGASYFINLLLGLKGTDAERSEFLKESEIDGNFAAKSNFYFELNNTKALFAENCGKQVRSVDLPYNPEINVFDYTPSWPNIYFTRNLIGKTLSSIVIASLNTVVYKKDAESVNLGIAQLLLAIKAYKLDTGNYPESLDQLAPKYLSSLPKDPFSPSGDLLEYSKDNLTISTVGPIKTDNVQPIPEYKIGF